MGIQRQNECFRKLAVQEAVKDQGLITMLKDSFTLPQW